MVDKCRLCGSSDLKLYFIEGDKKQFKYYICKKCKLVNYDLSTTGFDQEKYTREFIDPYNNKHKINKGHLQTYSFIRKHIFPSGKMLDIGCGNGCLLMHAKEDGWNVHGLELFEFLAEHTKKTTGIKVTVCDFLKYEKCDNETYDVIILRHVLEHLNDPVLAMKKINALLKNRGIAVLEFPNIRSLNLRLKYFLRRNGLYKGNFSSNYVPHHCNEFCKESFHYLVTKTGFILEIWNTYSSRNWLTPVYNLLGTGTKARVLVRKVSEIV